MGSAATPTDPLEAYPIRAYAEGDEAPLLALFRRAFRTERSPAEWERVYRANPAGGPWASVAVSPAGEVVGHYGGYPVRFERETPRGRETVLGVQVGDTMTAPEVRHVGRGPRALLARLAAHFYSSAGPRRAAFAYGFNTGAIQRFSLRSAGARLFEPARYRLLDLASAARALGWRAGAHRLAGHRARAADTFDARVDELWGRARRAYPYLVRRDREYLSWRYPLAGERGYRLVLLERGDELLGWGVFRRRDDRLTWGDALVTPEASGAAALLPAAALAGAGSGVARIDGWFSRHPAWWDEELRRLGFVEAPEPQALAFVFVPLAERDPLPAFRDRLYYTWGDSDLF